MINRLLIIDKLFKTITTLGYGALLAIFIIVLAPIEVLKVNNPTSIRVLTKKVTAGEAVSWIFIYEKYLNLKPIVTKTLRCPESLDLLPEQRQLPMGKHSVVLRDVVPLTTVPSAKCRIDLFLHYQYLYFKSIDYEFQTEEFEVVNPAYY